MNTFEWYQQLKKPEWAPPSWLFGPVWSVLYLLIAVSFGFVLLRFIGGRLHWSVVLPFALNLAFNAAFTPLQFGLRSNLLAAVDIILVLSTLVWAMIVIWPTYPWVALVNAPYLAWVSFATVLQLNIAYMNR